MNVLKTEFQMLVGLKTVICLSAFVLQNISGSVVDQTKAMPIEIPCSLQSQEDDENVYLCPTHWDTQRLLDFLVSVEDRPRTVRRRDAFVAAVGDAAERVVADEGAKKTWLRIAYLARCDALHYHACWGSEPSDQLLKEAMKELCELGDPELANDKRIKTKIEFLRLERELIEFGESGTQSASDETNNAALKLLERSYQFCSSVSLTDNHLRLASNVIRVANLIDSADAGEQKKLATKREVEFVRFGKLFEKSVDLKMSRYGRTLASTKKETSSFVGQQLELKGVGLDDEAINIARFSGKIVVVDFWATWCGPCVKEIPQLAQVYQEFADSGLEVVGVCLDKDLDEVREFVADKQVPWGNIIGQDAKRISDHYGVKSIPTMMLIDSNGEILMVGNRVNDILPELKHRLSGLLKKDSE